MIDLLAINKLKRANDVIRKARKCLDDRSECLETAELCVDLAILNLETWRILLEEESANGN